MQKALWTILLLAAIDDRAVMSAYVSPYDLMKCSYGERGSLTATCVNATASYFKSTPYRFDQLDESLRCLNCSLQTIDSGTFDISGNQIKNLDLSRSKIISLRTKAFVGLIFLEKLILSSNNIAAIQPLTFAGVKKIKSVDLSNNEIRYLADDGFRELFNLNNLNLENNKIAIVSQRSFSGLHNILTLNLKNNQISELKGSVSNLTSLQVLNLEHNRLTNLNGSEFANLTSLLELNLAFNKLQTPVIELQPQNSLKNLYLQYNAISKLTADSFLKGLHALETLDLSHNVLGEVSQKSLANLNKLRTLDMSYNNLSKFQTGTYSALPQLELLNCSHNTIKDIQITGVFSMHSLHTLDVSFNQISDLDYVGLISRLPSLSYLEMESNRLPCDLEDEMMAYFAEDNFKFVLYDNSLGAKKCEDVAVTKSVTLPPDALIGGKQACNGASGAEITIIILLSIIFACIGFLAFLQYRTYRYSGGRPSSGRALSATNLVEEEPKENEDYLRE